MPPERVAQAIVRAVRERSVEVYVPAWLRYAAWFCAICPGLMDRVLRRHYKIRTSAAR